MAVSDGVDDGLARRLGGPRSRARRFGCGAGGGDRPARRRRHVAGAGSTTAWWPRSPPVRRRSADLTLTLPARARRARWPSGALTASAAFMQGRMKTAGDLGLVLDVLAAVDARS